MASYDLIIKAVDRTRGPLRNVERGLQRVENRAQRVNNTLRAAGAAVIAFGTGSAIRGIVNQYREFERYRTVLTTFLGSQEKANAELARLQQLANSLPQDLADITQAFTIFSRFGIDTSAESLTAFSNIATANAKSLTQLGEAVADALTGEFERLKEFGIKVSKENDQFVARIGDQQVAVANSSQQLVQQLQRLGAQGGRFGGAAAANADTLNQSFSNLSGAVFETSVAFGEALKPALKDAVDLTTQLLRDNQELATTLGQGTGQAIRVLADGMRLLVENIELVSTIAQAVLGVKLLQYLGNVIKQGGRAAISIGAIARKLESGDAALTRSQTKLVNFTKAIERMGGRLASFGALLATPFRTVGTAITAVLAKLGLLRVGLAGLAAIGPLLMNPITLSIAAVGAAAYGLFKYFEDSYFKIGDMTTRVGELVRAIWFSITNKISEAWAKFTNFVGGAVESLGTYISNTWKSIKEAATPYIEAIGDAFRYAFNTVKDYLKTFTNNTIGAFVFVIDAIRETVFSIPDMFFAVFQAVKTTVLDFAGRIVQQFGNIGEAIKLAIEAPFTDATFADALAAATRNAFDGFGNAVSEEMEKVADSAPNYGQIAADAFTGEYADNIADNLTNLATRLTITGNQISDSAQATWNSVTAAVSEAGDTITGELQGMITAYRANQFAIGAARGDYDMYDDAILRTARNGQVLIQTLNDSTTATDGAGDSATNTAVATQELTDAASRLIQQLQQSNADLEDYQAALANVGELARISGLNENQLREALQDRIAALTGVTEAQEDANTATEEGARKVKMYTDILKEGSAELRFQQAQAAQNRKALAVLERQYENGSISLERFTDLVKASNLDLQDVESTTVSLALTISDSMKKAGDSLSRNLAEGLAKGKLSLNSFKDFFNQILDDILMAIIQKNITDPLVAQLTGALGGLGGGGGGGGFLGSLLGGLGGGGGFGNFFGNIWGGISSFFGGFFADGGYLPSGKFGIAGEAGPEIIKGPADVVPMQQLNNGMREQREPLTVNFNINAIDTRTGTEFLLQNKPQIIGMVSQAYNKQGRRGVVG